MANSVDPDETPRSAASHLGLYCLLRPVCPNTYGKYSTSTCFLICYYCVTYWCHIISKMETTHLHESLFAFIILLLFDLLMLHAAEIIYSNQFLFIILIAIFFFIYL